MTDSSEVRHLLRIAVSGVGTVLDTSQGTSYRVSSETFSGLDPLTHASPDVRTDKLDTAYWLAVFSNLL